jgi:hypothetical protein
MKVFRRNLTELIRTFIRMAAVLCMAALLAGSMAACSDSDKGRPQNPDAAETEQTDGATEAEQTNSAAEAEQTDGAAEAEQTDGTATDDMTDDPEDVEEMKAITMKINDEEVKVTWENNASVKALAELASEEPLTINTSMYGGFEQVGSIGATLPSSDVNTKTKPGDIVLYTSSQMVVFYGSNSWSYTRLGHIEDKSINDLKSMLGGENAVITISAE